VGAGRGVGRGASSAGGEALGYAASVFGKLAWRLARIAVAAALAASACSGDDGDQAGRAAPAASGEESAGEAREPAQEEQQAEDAPSAEPRAESAEADESGDGADGEDEQTAADDSAEEDSTDDEAEQAGADSGPEADGEDADEEDAVDEVEAEDGDEAGSEDGPDSGEEQAEQAATGGDSDEDSGGAAAGDEDEDALEARAREIRAAGSAPELTGLTRWLNSEPTTIARELAKGNVVLIDFWTYTCINCIRTFPFLVEWHEKYAEHGLVILGIHAPEFEFEKDAGNVRMAMEQYRIEYPVVQDNDFNTWRAHNNRYWPAKYLIGPTMDWRYVHFGEGDYPETEEAIRRALEEAGRDLSGVPQGISATIPQRDRAAAAQTRELYGGTHRNYGRYQYAAQPAYYEGSGQVRFYEDIDTSSQGRVGNKWYAQGLWRNGEEAMIHARETENLEDYIALNFTARTVNVVLNLEDESEPYRVYVELDGAPVRPEFAGEHVWFDDAGGYVLVDRNDLYRLVKLPEWSRHELKLRSNSDQFAMFAFTFGSYVGGE